MDQSKTFLLPRLYERDIDVLLQEEIVFNDRVRNLLSSRLKLESNLVVTQCALSVVDKTGETDLLARFTDDTATGGVLLIENKIDASFQPTQPQRYKARAQEIAANGEIAYCLLIAPERYKFGKADAVSHFDAFVSHEEIADAIASEQSARSRHRADILLRAVQQARSPYVAVPAPLATAMWQRIFKIANHDFPSLQMKQPGDKGPDSWWIVFKGDLPKYITLDWKIPRGTVDLSFWNGAHYKPVELSSLPQGAALVHSGTTTMIRQSISSPVDDWPNISDQAIRQALDTASSLMEFFNSNIKQSSRSSRS